MVLLSSFSACFNVLRKSSINFKRFSENRVKYHILHAIKSVVLFKFNHKLRYYIWIHLFAIIIEMHSLNGIFEKRHYDWDTSEKILRPQDQNTRFL